MTIYVICALAGNMWRESHINPGQGEAGGSGYGLFQWTGTRKTNLFTWLSNNNKTRYDGFAQLDYLVYENDWIQKYGEYATLSEFLNSASTDIEYLTECFARCWERPGVLALKERVEFANKAYYYIKNNGSYSTEFIYKATNKISEMLTQTQALQNAALTFHYFNGTIPVDPVDPSPTDPDDPVTELPRMWVYLAGKKLMRRKFHANNSF